MKRDANYSLRTGEITAGNNSSYTGSVAPSADDAESLPPPVPQRKPVVSSTNRFQHGGDMTETNSEALPMSANNLTGPSFRGRIPLLSYNPFNRGSGRTTATFLPKLSRTQNRKQFTTTDFANMEAGKKDNLPIMSLTLDDDIYGNKRICWFCSKKLMGVVLAGIILVGAVVGAVFAVSSSSSSSSDGSFCGSEERDQSIREFLASNFNEDEALNFFSVTYSDLIIECLPEQSFAALSDDEIQIMRQVAQIKFAGNAISQIHPEAFDSEFLSNVNFLIISDNGLSSVPDGLFDPLVALTTIDMSRNAFASESLPAGNFDNAPRLQQLFLDGNSGLTRIPAAVKTVNTLTRLTLVNCGSLVTVDEGILDLPLLQAMDLTNSAILRIFSEADFRAISKVGNDVFIRGYNLEA